MRNTNWAQLALVNLAVALFILLPFLPGPSNKFIYAFSTLANSAGFFGLLLIPVGCYWLLNGLYKAKSASRVPYVLAVCISVYIFLVCALVTLASFGVFGIITGIVCSIIITASLYFSIKFIKKIKSNPQSRFLPVSLYLVTIPLIAIGTRTFVAPLLSDYSRNFAIERGQKLVSAIEEFKTGQGRYPASISEIKDVPAPFIMGIDRFRYKPHNDGYLLSFTQWPDGGVTEEIVMFGKKEPVKQYIPYHEYDYKNDYHRIMGAFASYDTRHENWRYYLCD